MPEVAPNAGPDAGWVAPDAAGCRMGGPGCRPVPMQWHFMNIQRILQQPDSDVGQKDNDCRCAAEPDQGNPHRVLRATDFTDLAEELAVHATMATAALLVSYRAKMSVTRYEEVLRFVFQLHVPLPTKIDSEFSDSPHQSALLFEKTRQLTCDLPPKRLGRSPRASRTAVALIERESSMR